MPRVTLTPPAARELDGLPLTIRARMIALFERLERWPEVSGAKRLRGPRAGSYPMRTGDYRLIFEVQGDDILVEKLGHRDRFYED